MTFQDRVQTLLSTAGAHAQVHARTIGTDEQVGHDAARPMPLASTFKIVVLLELARQAAAGELDLTDREVVPVAGRSVGPTGLSVMLDPVELSLRDLSLLMMSISDNAATDVLMRRVGVDRMATTLGELGLSDVRVPETCQELLDRLGSDVGANDAAGMGAVDVHALTPDDREAFLTRVRRSDALAPTSTNQAPPRDMTSLLDAIWTDRAGPPEACTEVRRILGLHVFGHRLASGFGDDVVVAGKTGTLPFLRNEVGVVTHPDGSSHAIAVSVTTDEWGYRLPDLDRLVGTLARLAVDHLSDG